MSSVTKPEKYKNFFLFTKTSSFRKLSDIFSACSKNVALRNFDCFLRYHFHLPVTSIAQKFF